MAETKRIVTSDLRKTCRRQKSLWSLMISTIGTLSPAASSKRHNKNRNNCKCFTNHIFVSDFLFTLWCVTVMMGILKLNCMLGINCFQMRIINCLFYDSIKRIDFYFCNCVCHESFKWNIFEANLRWTWKSQLDTNTGSHGKKNVTASLDKEFYWNIFHKCLLHFPCAGRYFLRKQK